MSDRTNRKRHTLTRAFTCAMAGLCGLVRQERNIRFQIVVALLTIAVGVWLRLLAIEWAILTICIALVLVTEAINSAIELAVDHTSLADHPLAKQSKDIAAGAVLLAVMAAGVVGGILFIPKILAVLH